MKMSGCHMMKKLSATNNGSLDATSACCLPPACSSTKFSFCISLLMSALSWLLLALVTFFCQANHALPGVGMTVYGVGSMAVLNLFGVVFGLCVEPISLMIVAISLNLLSIPGVVYLFGLTGLL